MDKALNNMLDAINEAICKMYSFNYAAISASNKAGTKGNMLLDARVDYVAGQRKQFFDDLQKTKNIESRLATLLQELEQVKTLILHISSQVYPDATSFNEMFNGFNILHKGFKKDFEQLDYFNTISNPHPSFRLLCYQYLNYISVLKSASATYAYLNIASQLAKDVKDNGYQSISYMKPGNEIKFMTREEIVSQYKAAIILKKRSDETYKTALKNFKKRYKKPATKLQEQELLIKKKFIKASLEHEENQHDYVTELYNIAKRLINRLDAANSAKNCFMKHPIIDGAIDLFGGVLDSNEHKHKVDQIYVHDNELAYLHYLIKQTRKLRSLEVKENEFAPSEKI